MKINKLSNQPVAPKTLPQDNPVAKQKLIPLPPAPLGPLKPIATGNTPINSAAPAATTTKITASGHLISNRDADTGWEAVSVKTSGAQNRNADLSMRIKLNADTQRYNIGFTYITPVAPNQKDRISVSGSGLVQKQGDAYVLKGVNINPPGSNNTFSGDMVINPKNNTIVLRDAAGKTYLTTKMSAAGGVDFV